MVKFILWSYTFMAKGGIVMNKEIHILGFAGSLRKGSYNKAILSVAVEMVPHDATLEIFGLEGIPPFNQDLENNPPDKIKEFKAKIRSADAILIATPEYNFSIPGVLKNAIDWASRPFGDNAFEGKPVAVMGASVGMMGSARAQYHLRQTFIFLNMYPLNRPEVMVPTANEKIDGNGKLTDEKTRRKIKELVESLVTWARKMGP
jgi:chromate reductase